MGQEDDMRRTALVTGASAGLGSEFARQLAARGHDLLLVARREDRLRELAAEITARHGVRVRSLGADLSLRDAPEAIEAFTREQGVAIDYLVNNAGSAGPHLLDGSSWEDHARFLELMMLSVAHMCQRFVPGMRERGFGRVINVSSFAGRIARAAGASYGPAKAYLVALSEELALELRGTGVLVSALCPGFVHTDFHEVAGLTERAQSLPGLLWYDAPTVVREGIEAVERGRPIMVSGRLYRWLDPLVQSVWLRPLIQAVVPGT
jgi:short-subunit dehydrogenase